MSLRLVFMGTPDFAVPVLSALLAEGHDIVAVYSQPPRPAGRGMTPRPSPVQAFAERQGLPVHTPVSLKSRQEQDRFAELGADAAIVVAYGLILPEPVLQAPRHGAWNLHASLLPRWRGAAPIQRAIMAGDARTGVMVMKMDEGLDTGPVAMAEAIDIAGDMTAGELHDKLAALGAGLMVQAMAALEQGKLKLTPQHDDQASYAAKISKEETRIIWSRTATEVHNHIRGLSPFPGAWFVHDFGGGPERVKVLRCRLADETGHLGGAGTVLDDSLTIACGDGAVILDRMQRAGRKPADMQEFLRGNPVPKGTVLA